MASSNTSPDLQLQLPALTSFLTLAPTTSACYPTHRRTQSMLVSSSSKDTSSAESSSSTAVVPAEESVCTTPLIPTNVAEQDDLKLHRSSSESSDASVKSFRFLRLGPVHHGEQDDDWSEEIAVLE